MLSILNPPLDILYLKERIQSENKRYYNYSLFKRKTKIRPYLNKADSRVGVPGLNAVCYLLII